MSDKQLKKKKQNTKKYPTPNKKSPSSLNLENMYFVVLCPEHHMRVAFVESFVFSL